MRSVVIPANQAIPVFQTDLAGLDQLQDAVGGYIESLPVPGVPNATAYINEEGKFDPEREINFRATIIWAKNEALFPGDYIVGDLVITGLNPETGEQIPVPDNFMTEAPHGERRDGRWIIDMPDPGPPEAA
jgi:hypothetical protein